MNGHAGITRFNHRLPSDAAAGDNQLVPTRAPTLLAMLLIAPLISCAGTRGSRAPTHEQLVTDHLRGNYEQVLRWCPVILEDRGAEPGLSDWCLFGYPAALRLSLDTTHALEFMRTVCTDVTGRPRGDEDFRVFYVREVARWFALPMRWQKQDKALPRAVGATVDDFARVCRVSPRRVHHGLDTKI